MVFTKELIISIICVLIGGISIGYLLYGIFKAEVRKVIPRAIFFLIVSVGVFFYINYDYFFAKEINIPYPISEMEYYDESNFENAKGVVDFHRNEDKSLTIKLSPSKYKEFENVIIEELEESITELQRSKGLGIEKIEHNGSFTEFEVKYFLRDYSDYYLYVAEPLIGYGRVYNAFISKDEDANIVIKFTNEQGDTTKEISSLGERDQQS